jgi:AraC-like DNA-binding protein
MARRTFMRAFSAQAGMSFGRWRQQARLFAALEMPAQSKSVMEVAIAVGYDSVSAFIEMFRTMLGTTPQTYFRGRYSWAGDRAVAATARLPFFRQTTPRIVVSLVAHRDSDLSVFISFASDFVPASFARLSNTFEGSTSKSKRACWKCIRKK